MQTNSYPINAGHRGDGASKLAAHEVDSNPDRKLQTQISIVVAAMVWPDYVVDQIASEIGEDRLYVRPRASELVNMGVLVKRGKKISPSFGRVANLLEASADLIRWIDARECQDVGDLRMAIGSFILSRIELERRTKKIAKHGA